MGAARFSILCPECIRIEYSPTGIFCAAPSMMSSGGDVERGDDALSPIVVEDVECEAPFVLSTRRCVLRFTPRGVGLSATTLKVEVAGPFAPGGPTGTKSVWVPGALQRGNLGGTLSTLDGLQGAEPLPDGLLSRDGWFLIDDSRGHVMVDGWVRTRAQLGVEENTDWYLLAYGADYRAGLRAFTRLAGRVPMPRRCAMGSWYSRYWPHDSAEYRKIVSEYDDHGVPLDVMVLDMDWHRPGWTGWSWNRELLPDAEGMLSWLHERGVAVTLNLHPSDGVGPHEDRYAEFMRAIGHNPASGETVQFDAGDKKYMDALFEHMHRPLEREGVDFWWLDWQQEKFVRSVPGLTNLAWLNHLYFEHTRGAGATGKRGLSFSRWPETGDGGEGGWCDHRHPIHFSGDAHTGWEMLAFQVPFSVLAGNVGCFYWSHDIGGHFGPRSEETTTRWVQFGALGAALRLHSARTAALDRRPWTYEAQFFGSMREAFRLRSELMPYIYTQARTCFDESLPLLRPMFIGDPLAVESYRSAAQYMLGDHLLVAPVVTPGIGAACVATQAVWFPRAVNEGAPRSWFRWSTGERYAAGDEAIVGATIDEVPLFAPGGVPIPLQPVTMRMTSGGASVTVVRLWPGEPGFVGRAELYEDDGESRGYEHGRCGRTAMIAEWRLANKPGRVLMRLTIGPTIGEFDGQVDARALRIEFAATSALCELVVDGRPAHATDESQLCGGLVVVELAARNLLTPMVIDAEVEVMDGTSACQRHAARRLSAAFDWQPDDQQATISGMVEKSSIDLATSGGEDANAALAIGLGVGIVRHSANFVESASTPETYRLCDSRGSIDNESAEVEVVDQVGTQARTVARHTLKLAGTGRSRGAEIAIPSLLLRDPPLGVRATRWIRAECSIGGRAVAIAERAESRLLPIASWRVIGPFDWHWAGSITTQSGSAERGGWGSDDRHHGVGGAWLAWRNGQSSNRWATDFRLSLNAGNESGLGYAVTHLVCTRAQTARLVVESSDKLEAWLNGEKVYSQDGFDTQAAIDEGGKISLKPGRNLLLVKCVSGGSGWGFTVRVEGSSAIGAETDDAEGVHSLHPFAG